MEARPSPGADLPPLGVRRAAILAPFESRLLGCAKGARNDRSLHHVVRLEGARIRDCRRRKGLSIHVLARRARVGEKTVRRLELDQVEAPRPDTIRAIADALEVPFDALFGSESRCSDRARHDRAAVARAAASSSRPTVAILRFDDCSDHGSSAHFAAGLVEDLVTRFAAWRVLPIIAPSSSSKLGSEKPPLQQIARELGARYLVCGSVRRSHEELQILVQLFDGRSEDPVWSGRFCRAQSDDVLRAQDEISQDIMSRLREQVAALESRRAMQLPEAELQSWDACVRGWWHLHRGTLHDTRLASALFARSTELEPGLAFAWAGRANAAIAEMRFLGPSRERLDRAREWAERAIRCDPELAHGFAALASSYLNLGRVSEATYAQQRAAELDPSLAIRSARVT